MVSPDKPYTEAELALARKIYNALVLEGYVAGLPYTFNEDEETLELGIDGTLNCCTLARIING